MKFYVFADAGNMRRVELTHHQLFGLGHELTLPWQECYQVDRQVLAASDAVVILLRPDTDAAEVLRCALAAEKPVLLWREPGAERVELELDTHRLVMKAGGNIANTAMLQALAVTASEMVRNHAAGTFERQRYGGAHAQPMLDAIKRGPGAC